VDLEFNHGVSIKLRVPLSTFYEWIFAKLQFVLELKYLGHIITYDLSDDVNMLVRPNILAIRCSSCSIKVCPVLKTLTANSSVVYFQDGILFVQTL
jgi:hypothetical protein